MVRGYERYYQKASRSTRDQADGAWSPSLDTARGGVGEGWRGPYGGPRQQPAGPVPGADASLQPPQ